MKADLIFENIEIFGVESGQRIRVRTDETFRIDLQDVNGEVFIATVNDRMLDLRESGTSAMVETTATGTGEIQVQDGNRNVRLWLDIEVYSPNEATALNPTPGEPELKSGKTKRTRRS